MKVNCLPSYDNRALTNTFFVDDAREVNKDDVLVAKGQSNTVMLVSFLFLLFFSFSFSFSFSCVTVRKSDPRPQTIDAQI